MRARNRLVSRHSRRRAGCGVLLEPIGEHDPIAEIGIPGCDEHVDGLAISGERQKKPAIVLGLPHTIEGALNFVEGRLAASGALPIVPLDELSVIGRAQCACVFPRCDPPRAPGRFLCRAGTRRTAWPVARDEPRRR